MGAITGFCSFKNDYLSQSGSYTYLLERMSGTLAHRGPGGSKSFLDKHIGFSMLYDKTGNNAMRVNQHGRFTVISDCEIYNHGELRHLLESKGFTCETKDLSELILGCYLYYGLECASVINGVFAFALWDNEEKTLFLCRDRLGVKPLFYTFSNQNLVFASEMKALFDFPGVNARLDKDGLCEIFGLFPSRTEGNGVFAGIKEIKYGHYGLYKDGALQESRYWDVTSAENDFTPEEAVEHTRNIVTDAVKRQMETNLPLCSFLSGGLDSSVVTAIAAGEYAKEGKTLDTFSFDYEDNDIHFKGNDFQADTDKQWAAQVSALYKTNHRVVECGIHDLANHLYPAVTARDLPGMADVDSSMLYFCKEAAKTHAVALTGECADELFGGYPWFHSREAFETHHFPWIRNADFRKDLLSPELLSEIDIESYTQEKYEETIAAVPVLPGESPEEARRREISYLNIKWFMTNLIDRTERMGMHSSFVGRVPYADYRIAGFLWNIPWSLKCDGTPKSLLREAFRDLLPEALINRKKCPFPKTYHPKYEALLKEKMKCVLNDASSPLLPFLNQTKMAEFLQAPGDYGKPWYGQLMAAPQLIAFYIQTDYWLRKYSVSVL